jgi:hypothetical protein
MSEQQINFLIQADDVMRAEKLAVRNAAASRAGSILQRVGLADLGRDDVPGSYVPVGTVKFCRKRLRQLGLALPKHLSYPPVLIPFLSRPLRVMSYQDVDEGDFVKPFATTKEFTGHLKGQWPPDEPVPTNLGQLKVWTSPPIKFVSEYRCYVLHDRLAGSCRYDDDPDPAPMPDLAVVQAAIEAMTGAGAPAGYSLDFGVVDDGRTLLIEANDGWALGYYRDHESSMTPDAYVALIAARWAELWATEAVHTPCVGA